MATQRGSNNHHSAIVAVLVVLGMTFFQTTSTPAAPIDSPNDPYARLHYNYPVPKADPAQTIEADICVYGATLAASRRQSKPPAWERRRYSSNSAIMSAE